MKPLVRRRRQALNTLQPRKRPWQILFFCAIMLPAISACQQRQSDDRALPGAADYLNSQFSSFSDDSTLFVKALTQAAKVLGADGMTNARPVQAGIVAHHLFVADLMAEYFMKVAAATNPKKIILLGPNHRGRGTIPIAATLLPWKTPFGTLRPHRATIAQMVSAEVVAINDDAFFMEHSIGALLPFIKRIFPSASIIPLVLLANAPPEACDRLSDWLAQHLDGETLLLASLDFSHYQTAAMAAREDSVTLPILQALAFERARAAYVDSRATLRVLLRTLKLIGAGEGEIVHHTNSGLVSGQLQEPCTSYINMIWRRPMEIHESASIEKGAPFTVLIGGDILLHPSIARRAYSREKRQYQLDDLFSGISPLLKQADVALANLEGTFAGAEMGISFFPRHNYPDELAVALRNAGFTAISLANNHAADTGCAGLKRTCDVLAANGLAPVGLSSPTPITTSHIRSVQYAILAYTYGVNLSGELDDCEIRPALIDVAAIENDIKRSRQAGAQIVIVFLHTGMEYQAEVEPGLKELARQLAAAGTDAVVGAHPHAVRPWEWVQAGSRRVFVHYSLGNLLSWHRDSRYNQGELALLFFEDTTEGYCLQDANVIRIGTKYSVELGKFTITKI
jgi:AmmeMemoRadiSam system protein B